ncbi:MAG: sigma-70 family RNA polymerase sigma factor [Myxococcota bacterium]
MAIADERLDALYREHARYIAGVATRVLGRDDEVDDVVQDVFVQAMKDLRQVRDPGAIRSWLARITVRTARRQLRKRRLRRWFSGERDYDYSRLAARGLTPERAAELARLYEVLDTLPVDERVAWSLRNIEGHSLEAVATMCECSLATAKRRIARAVKGLRKHVDDG